MKKQKYTHFRFGVGCHDLNGFWYSNHMMTYDDFQLMEKQWAIWKKLEAHWERDPDDDREMLIDQLEEESGDLYDTIVIPSKYADNVQQQIFGERYEKIKFDIWAVKPPTLAETREKSNLQ